MVEAYINNINRAEVIIDGNPYEADIIRITQIDYKSMKVLVRGEYGEGIVTAVKLYNKEEEMIADLPRQLKKPTDQYIYTTLLFDLMPAEHPDGLDIIGGN